MADTIELARELTTQWISTLARGNAQEVVALYTNDMTFHPTRSGRFITDQTAAVSYFEGFLKAKPQVTIRSDDVYLLSTDALLHTGVYEIVTTEASQLVLTVARFSFVWRKVDGKWLILHHHSSASPNGNVE